MGYYRAGFDVIGIDIVPQPNYPFPMMVTHAISWMNTHTSLFEGWGTASGWEFDAIHASPPCQRWSKMSNCRTGLAKEYPDYLNPTREWLLENARVPWVIENVEGAPLRDPINLCGFMFDHELFRHRLFESSIPLKQPDHPKHPMIGSRAGHWTPGTVISVSGHCSPMWKARQEMAISWTNREELAEAIPPYFTEYVGRQLREYCPVWERRTGNTGREFQCDKDLRDRSIEWESQRRAPKKTPPKPITKPKSSWLTDAPVLDAAPIRP